MADWDVVSSTPSAKAAPPRAAAGDPWAVVSSAPITEFEQWRRQNPPKADEAPAETQQGFVSSLYHGLVRPAWDGFKGVLRGEGPQMVSDAADALLDQVKTFAAHPDVRNIPVIGPAAQQTANKMQADYDAKNYSGMAGQLAVGLAPFVAPEVIKGIPGAASAVSDAAETLAKKLPKSIPTVSGAAADVAGVVSPRAAHAIALANRGIKIANKVLGPGEKAEAAAAPVLSAEDLARQRNILETRALDRAALVDRTAQGIQPDQPAPALPEAAPEATPPVLPSGRVPGGWDAVSHTPSAPPTPVATPAAKAAARAESNERFFTQQQADIAAEQETPQQRALSAQQRIEDAADAQAAQMQQHAEDIIWANRAHRADRFAAYLLREGIEPTRVNLERAAKEMAEKGGAPSDETVDMIHDRMNYQPQAAEEATRSRLASALAPPEAETPAAEPAPEARAAVAPPEQHLEDAKRLPQASRVVDGLKVRQAIPNLESIDSSLEDAEELPGVREVPFSLFKGAPGKGNLASYSATENARVENLAGQIGESGEINPLIVVYDKDGPYILEGGHRFDALSYKGHSSFPAKVVIDRGSLGYPDELAAEPETPLEQQLRASVEAQNAKKLQSGAPNGNSNQPAAVADPGSTGKGPALHAPPRPGGSRLPAAGDATRTDVPGEPRSYAGQYEVRELADVQPSHHGATFQPNPAFEYENDRNYDDPVNQGKIVNWSVQGPTGFKPRQLINTASDATTGPPVIDSRGNVLGGNGRTMILQRVYDSNPVGARAYRGELDRAASHYGIDPATYANMKQPVLVRTLDDGELASHGAPQKAITDFNKTGTAAMTPSEQAVADSHGVSLKTLDDISARMDREGPDATLNQALEGNNGVEVLQNLIRDGVLTPQEAAKFASEDKLTRAGRERISGLMTGRFFADAKQMDAIPDAVRSKMERIAAPLARAEGSPAFSLAPKVREALSLMEDANAHGALNVDDFAKQLGFGNRRYSPDAIALANQLKTRDPIALTNAVRGYAAAAKYAGEYQGPGIFGDQPPPLTPRQAFDAAFGQKAIDAEAAAKAAKRAAAAKPELAPIAAAVRSIGDLGNLR